MKAKSFTAKEKGIAYLRGEIEILAEQADPVEKHAFHMRAQASLMTLMHSELLTEDEFHALGNEIGEANEKAAALVRKATGQG